MIPIALVVMFVLLAPDAGLPPPEPAPVPPPEAKLIEVLQRVDQALDEELDAESRKREKAMLKMLGLGPRMERRHAFPQ